MDRLLRFVKSYSTTRSTPSRVRNNSIVAQDVMINSCVVRAPCRYQNHPQDAQKGRPARPQRAKGRIVLVQYGESLRDARTPLADFFRILLGLEAGHEP